METQLQETSRRSPSPKESLPFNFVFVYGTLKRGQPNHHWISKQLFVCEAETFCRYPLVIFDRLPFLINRQNSGQNVRGELFKVSDRVLHGSLDRLEQHPVVYTRKLIITTQLHNQKRRVAWAYFLNDELTPEPYWRTLPTLTNYIFGGIPPSNKEL